MFQVSPNPTAAYSPLLDDLFKPEFGLFGAGFLFFFPCSCSAEGSKALEWKAFSRSDLRQALKLAKWYWSEDCGAEQINQFMLVLLLLIIRSWQSLGLTLKGFCAFEATFLVLLLLLTMICLLLDLAIWYLGAFEAKLFLLLLILLVRDPLDT
eukprot:Gb_23158 [translate_table: standard]